MPRIYDRTDYFFSYDGDFAVGPDKDIMDTSYDPLRAAHQEILSRIRSDKGDWVYNPAIGATLSRFVGMPNTQETANAMRQAMLASLQYDNTVDISDVKIQIVPVAFDMVAIRIELAYIRTRQNANSSPVTLTFLYDYQDNNVYPIENPGYSVN